MIVQLLMGSLLVCVSVFITAGFVAICTSFWEKNGASLLAKTGVVRVIFALSSVVLWMLAALSTSVWVWAGAFMALGIFETLEESVYFSVVSFTTLGFGDVVIGKDWRLLSGIIAANGLILFSLITAYLLEFVVHLRAAKTK